MGNAPPSDWNRVVFVNHHQRTTTMKRSLTALATVLALTSAGAYAQTAGVEPSFKDYAGSAPNAGDQTVTPSSASDSANSGASKNGSANAAQGKDRSSAHYAQSSHRATRSDAGSDASSGASSNRGFGAGSAAHEPAETLNDSFHYPSY
jgi:hypothetical protein